MLQLKNIFKKYTTGEFTQIALDGVSLNFRKNEFAAILGPSGSGKTTLLNIIGGLDQYDEGDLLINGQSTKKYKDGDWDAYRNNSVGFIFQSYNLIGHLTVLDNVKMGMTLSGVPKAEQNQRALDVLERVGLKEHTHKKPNQLSGGQMQRVAIARSLVNDPDIILADEPTGALDTQTSQQIMDLIAEIAKDKLVIMVTHNPDLAEEFADRIIEFRDGEVMSDSNPMTASEPSKNYQLKKTSMSFWNALTLSGKNIWTKKWRTALIAFASSIGIIGIALVLSLSNGFSKQIDSIENDTLSGFPITITETANDMTFGPSNRLATEEDDKANEKQRKTEAVFPEQPAEEETVHENSLSKEYIAYLADMDSNLISGMSFTRNVNMNLIHQNDGEVAAVQTDSLNLTSYPTNGEAKGSSFLEQNYDLLAGSYPTGKNDLILVVGENNQLASGMVDALGLDSSQKEINFDQFIGQEMTSIFNDDFYTETNGFFKLNPDLTSLYEGESGTDLKIVGVIRGKEDLSIAGLSEGIKYSDTLAQEFIGNAQKSAIVLAQEAADFNVMTGEVFSTNTGGAVDPRSFSPENNPLTATVSIVTKDQLLTRFGAIEKPSGITIYPADFEKKEQVLEHLDQWNKDQPEEKQVVYTDMAATVTSLMGNTLDAITVVLVAFAAISLVVSLIMIGIITYISVMERTKEIGVLRALGARKKDITRVFNAETFIIGTFSGLLGIGIAYLVTIPANIVMENVTGLADVAQLNPLHALALIIVSVLLTMLGGLIPARLAAKKDPVEALRSE
ncbi:ATP-binding cassette domain-containing protein [Carnobacterium maltaromaticum]|uniref:ABC transporter ATP-binding protein/permease n=1 Tax=Carnobacterium maltaromaticum TaxID=2751 RepID=UPI00191BB452|nr:ABC transporter ATP-binding protein/permease [Carnobacterium maltaromaticum]CAD5902602.1 ABC transporter family protein [Carnobacterium maltaromaticum]